FWTVILVLAFTLSNKSIETYLLNATVGPAEVGFFAIAAARRRGGVDLLASGLITVMMRVMAHAFGRGGLEQVNRIMSTALRHCVFLGLMLIGVGLLCSRPGVMLLYGDEYAQVLLPLRVMIVVGGLTLGESAFTALLSTTDNQRLRVVFSALFLGLSVVFAFLLVPRYGLVGAVASYACSRLLATALLWVAVSRMLRLRLPLGAYARLLGSALLAGVVAASLALLMPGMGSAVAAVGLFSVLFFAASIALNAWRSSVVARFLGFLERYPFLHGRMSGVLERWAM